MFGPYLEDFSSGYAMTSLFAEPKDVDVPVTDEAFYYNASTELGYSPLLARMGNEDVHVHMKSSNSVPDGHIYIPKEMAEKDFKRVPDQKTILIAKRGGANVIYNMVEKQLEGRNHG